MTDCTCGDAYTQQIGECRNCYIERLHIEYDRHRALLNEAGIDPDKEPGP